MYNLCYWRGDGAIEYISSFKLTKFCISQNELSPLRGSASIGEICSQYMGQTIKYLPRKIALCVIYATVKNALKEE